MSSIKFYFPRLAAFSAAIASFGFASAAFADYTADNTNVKDSTFTSAFYNGFNAEHKLSLSGYIDLQYGYIDQKGEFETNPPADPTKDRFVDNGLFTDAELFILYDMDINEDHKIGSKITLYTSVGPAKNGSVNNGKLIKFYYQGPTGKYEIGEMAGASIEMQKSANNIAKATGGIDGDFDRYEGQLTIDGSRKDTIFVNYPYMPIGSDFNTRRFKLSYYSPKFKGLQFGISYTPDIDNSGTIANIITLTNTVRPRVGRDLVAYKDIVEGGFTYEIEHNNVNYEFAALSQFGSSKRVIDDMPRDNLRAFEVGSIISYKEYSVAGSYGDWGESGTSSIKVPGAKYGAKYFTAGLAYQDEKFGASATYLHSKRAGGSRVFAGDSGLETAVVNETEYNKLNVFSLGTDYKIAEGFKAYLEYTSFHYDRSETPLDNSGAIYLFGLKINF